MKKRNINKKVIVATSYNTQEVIREVSDYGVNYYILKPFDFDTYFFISFRSIGSYKSV